MHAIIYVLSVRTNLSDQFRMKIENAKFPFDRIKNVYAVQVTSLANAKKLLYLMMFVTYTFKCLKNIGISFIYKVFY